MPYSTALLHSTHHLTKTMISSLISHSWKEKMRSPIWAKNMLANLFLAFAAIMLCSYMLILGISLKPLLYKFFPDEDPIQLVNGALIYYFFFEFTIRFFLQNVPVLSIQPYLHLPIKKGSIIHFMLRKSQLSVFNLMAIFTFTPFAIMGVGSEYGALAGFVWWLTIVGVAMTIHFATIFFKKKLNDMPNLLVGLWAVFLGLGALDYFGIVSLSSVSDMLFGAVIGQPAFAAVPIVLWLVFYRLNHVYLFNNTYPEELATKKEQAKISGDFAFLKRFGRIGELIALDLKLILRHKRPRNTLVMGGFLLFYGLIFYTQDTYMEKFDHMFLFVGIFITGIFLIQHGQFLLSWESSYFDFVLVRKTTFKEFFEAKYYMFVAFATIAFVVSLGYAYFGWRIVLFNLAAYFFNIGVNAFIIMRLSMMSPKKIDLNKRAAFNYEGVGAAQFIIAIPVLLLPYLFYVPLAIAGYANMGLVLTAVVGLIGFLLRDKLLDWLTKEFTKKRHEIAAGFRAQ